VLCRSESGLQGLLLMRFYVSKPNSVLSIDKGIGKGQFNSIKMVAGLAATRAL